MMQHVHLYSKPITQKHLFKLYKYILNILSFRSMELRPKCVCVNLCTSIFVSIKMFLRNYRQSKIGFCHFFFYFCSVVRIDFLFVIRFCRNTGWPRKRSELSDVRKLVSFSICEHILLHFVIKR